MRGFFGTGLKWAVVLFASLMLTGCWDVVEVRHDAFIVGIGIDQINERKLEVSLLQLVIPETKSGNKSSGGDKEGTKYTMISATGESLSECVQKLRDKLEERLTLSKVAFVVFGNDIARQGLNPYLDYFYRSNEIDQGLQLFVAKDDARSLFEKEKGKLVHFAVSGFSYKPTFLPMKLWMFTPNVFSVLEGSYIPIIDIRNGNLTIAGMGLFNRSRMTTVLQNETMNFLNILLDRHVKDIILFSNENRDQSFRIDSVQRKIRWSEQSVRIDYRLKGSIIQSTTETTMPSQKQLETKIAMKLERDLVAVLLQAHNQGVDILGIGEKFRQNQWSTNRWLSKLKHLGIQVHCDVTIISGLGKTH